jgi:hypothetical protein
MAVAQTNIQLYNQLRERGASVEELVLARRAYELGAELWSGYYQGDGKPFVAHTVGVASLVAELDQPIEFVAVGLVHNVYANGDFGEGISNKVTPARRRVVREALGERIEQLLVRFRDLRIRPDTLERIRADLARLDESDRRLLIVDLADYLEMYVDHGAFYFGNGDWLLERSREVGPHLIEIAGELGEPRLAEMLSATLARATEQADDIPAELRESDGRRFLDLVVPRSCRPRLSVRLRTRLRRV